MHDLRAELAALVADVAEAFEGLRGQGTRFVPLEPHPFVPSAAPPARVAGVPPARLAPAPRSPPVAQEPPPPPVAAEPGVGLLGRWADKLAGPAERLRRAQESLAASCAGCGDSALLAKGGLTSGMALLYDAGTEADEAILTNMLVRVLGVEPADVLTVHPRTCTACASGVHVQLEAARPRVVLALGPNARAMLAIEPGRWTRFAGADAIGSWHPSEQGADPARKRGAFEVLKQVASRR